MTLVLLEHSHIGTQKIYELGKKEGRKEGWKEGRKRGREGGRGKGGRKGNPAFAIHFIREGLSIFRFRGVSPKHSKGTQS